MISLKNQSNWYPPSKYFFMPLYRKLRKKFSQKYAVAHLTLISVLIHLILPLAMYIFDKNNKEVVLFFQLCVYIPLLYFVYSCEQPRRKRRGF